MPSKHVSVDRCGHPVEQAADRLAGQLGLAAGASAVDPTVVAAYEDLWFPHAELELSMGVLVPVVDAVTGQTVPVPAPMTADKDHFALHVGVGERILLIRIAFHPTASRARSAMGNDCNGGSIDADRSR